MRPLCLVNNVRVDKSYHRNWLFFVLLFEFESISCEIDSLFNFKSVHISRGKRDEAMASNRAVKVAPTVRSREINGNVITRANNNEKKTFMIYNREPFGENENSKCFTLYT